MLFLKLIGCDAYIYKHTYGIFISNLCKPYIFQIYYVNHIHILDKWDMMLTYV